MKQATILLAFALLGCGAPPSNESGQEQEKHAYVLDGKPLAVVEDFHAWEREEGYIEGRAINNMLYAPDVVDTGDFHLYVRMSVTAVTQNPAAFLEIGQLHLWLVVDATAQDHYLTGAMLEDTVYAQPTEPLVEGEPFVLEVLRKGEMVQVLVNGNTTIEALADSTFTGKVGVYPWHSTVQIMDFTASGSLVPFEPAVSFTPVFKRGEQGYNTFRIPAIVDVDGSLLTFCEGRKNGRGDEGDVDLVMKRSDDEGATWSELEVVFEVGDTAHTAIGNPTVILDDRGTLHLFARQDWYHIYYLTSNDVGQTWSTPKDITEVVKAVDFPAHRLVTGPGHAIQLKHEAHSKRLLVPVWMHDTVNNIYNGTAMYSDDYGASWTVAAPIDLSHPGSNEAQVVELHDGTIMMTIRMQQNGQQCRAVAYSNDGGATWPRLQHEPALPDPRCHASINSISLDTGSVLVFANPANTNGRSRMTLRYSTDEGQTWAAAKLLNAGPSAYADLVALPGDKVGCLYEAGHHFMYEVITFQTISVHEIRGD